MTSGTSERSTPCSISLNRICTTDVAMSTWEMSTALRRLPLRSMRPKTMSAMPSAKVIRYEITRRTTGSVGSVPTMIIDGSVWSAQVMSAANITTVKSVKMPSRMQNRP